MGSRTHFALTGDLSEFEAGAESYGIGLRAVQLERGEAQVDFSLVRMGNAQLTALSASRLMAVDWQTRADTLNFSIQVGSCGVQFEGKERGSFSIILYQAYGVAEWAGRVGVLGNASDLRPGYHVSVPVEAAELLSLPGRLLTPGWLELPLSSEMCDGFVRWAEPLCRGRSGPVEMQGILQDQVYWWLQEMMAPVVYEETRVEPVSHYMRIVRRANSIADSDPASAFSVVDIAARLKISVRTLQRAYRTTFGLGVSSYLRNRRLRRAHDMLRAGEITVHRAAYLNGFHHLPRFSQHFRNVYGFYPSDAASRRK